METERDTLLIEEIVGYIRNSHNKVHILKKLLLVRELSSLCSDYRRASLIYEHVTRVLKKDTCDLQLVAAFVETCGKHFADWVILEGSLDTLELFLEFSNRVKYTMYRKGFSPRRIPDYHPVNRSIYGGRTANVPLLLKYGLGLEFTESFYDKLQISVIKNLVPSSQRSECLKSIKRLRNWRRVFLVFLVIRTYNKSEQFPRFYKGADEALKMIWRAIPDYFLCRSEILEIFEDVDVNLSKLKKISERYEKFVCESEFTDLAQPRSLAHHSRCKVRQVLSFNKELPTGVEMLPIPVELKPYLLLE